MSRRAKDTARSKLSPAQNAYLAAFDARLRAHSECELVATDALIEACLVHMLDEAGVPMPEPGRRVRGRRQ